MTVQPAQTGDDDRTYRIEFSPGELKIAYTALRLLLDGYGHDEEQMHKLIRSALGKFPAREEIDSIDLRLPRTRPRL